MAFDPVDFVARLAALVPKPRVNLTRYQGMLAPNLRRRGEVTPAKRGTSAKRISNGKVRSTVEHEETYSQQAVYASYTLSLMGRLQIKGSSVSEPRITSLWRRLV